LKTRAREFAAKSGAHLFKHCTGAIDGLAIRVAARSKGEVQNLVRFYNGNKKSHCLNMQAVCDANHRFIAVCCKHTGNTNDIDAFAITLTCGDYTWTSRGHITGWEMQRTSARSG
jgi:hypothetical protein